MVRIMATKAYATMDRALVISGVVADTFGTEVNYALPTWCKAVLGINAIGVDLTPTAAQGKSQILRMSCKSLGMTNEEFSITPIVTSSPATNEGGVGSVSEMIPLDLQTGGGEVLTFSTAPAGASTVAMKSEIGILMSDNPKGLPSDWKLHFPNIVGLRGGKVQDAQQLTVARTALTAIKTPSWAEAIVGYKALFTKTGAVTASECDIGYFDLVSSMGLTPITLPATFAGSGSIGTPVDGGPHADRVPYTPIYIPLTGKEETFTPYVVLDLAVSTDNRVAIALAWR